MRDTVGYQGNTSTGKDEWLTPEWIIKALGPFDLDPCAPAVRPWPTAKDHLTKEMDGLKCDWGKASVWCNPPYDNIEAFFEKCVENQNAIGLCFNRTETEWFDKYVWQQASGVLFYNKRIKFCNVDGSVGGNGPGAGSVFVAWGIYPAYKLEVVSKKFIPGKFIRLR